MFERRHPYASLFTMALILGMVFWFVGGSRVKDLAPYYVKRVLGETATVTIRGKMIRAEVAKTPRAREKGLAGRDYLAPDKGMLFVFPALDVYPFTMRRTPISLDIVWINTDRIVRIVERAKPETPIIHPGVEANYVLEVREGIAAAGWQVGDEVQIVFELSPVHF